MDGFQSLSLGRLGDREVHVNQIFLIGNLGRDPETSTTANGHQLCRFSIATTEYYGNEQRETTWHNILCWRELAKFISPQLRKGTKVFVEGRLTCREWEKDGQKRYAYEIVAKKVYVLARDDQQQSEPRPPPGSGGDEVF
jgi:single-strand DNA-binding protein